MRVTRRRGSDGIVRRRCYSEKTGKRVKCPPKARTEYEHRGGRHRKVGTRRWFCRPLPRR